MPPQENAKARCHEHEANSRLTISAALGMAVTLDQVQGSAEPGLILTPPPKGISDPKITTLKLDADWVVLSCNTAGPRDEGAEALSGLAREIFYAGARALLVSNWRSGQMPPSTRYRGIRRTKSAP